MRGGGIISTIGGFFYFIIKCIFFLVVGICLLLLFGVVSIIAMLIFGAYKFVNEVLAGTNAVIGGLNTIIKPIVKAGFVFINVIIDGINELINGLNAAGGFFTEMIPEGAKELGKKVVGFGDEIGKVFSKAFGG